MIPLFFVLLAAAYFAGSIPLGVLVCRARGIDIFSIGSGNIGATNVTRALGKKWGIAVFAGDVLKAFLPTMAARLVLPDHQTEWAIVGVCAVAGHIFSPFLGFKGGKGISCALGMAFAVSPLTALSAFALFLLVFAVTRYVSLSSITAVPSAAAFSWFYHDERPVVALFGTMAVVTIVLHRKNIQRLRAGTEPKFGANQWDAPAEKAGEPRSEPENQDEKNDEPDQPS